MTEFISRKYGDEGYEVIIKTDNHEHYKASENFARQLIDHAKPVTDNNDGCKWIPVSERLPGENGDYLVFKGSSYGGWCEVAGFAKDGSEVDEYDLGGCENVWYDYDSEYGYIAFDSVTHWMTLPEPPKEA